MALYSMYDDTLNVHETDDRGNTPLHTAIENNHIDLVKFLLAQNADINMRNYSGNTPFHTAIENNHIEIVEFLLDQNADINIKNYAGNKPLHIATSNKHRDITHLLLNHGANINEIDNRGNTLLHRATPGNQIDIVQFLLDHGANINEMNYCGYTPLHIAANYNRLDIAQILLNRRANIHAQSTDSDDILTRAVMWDYTEMIKLLIKHKAHLNAQHVKVRSAADTTKDLLIISGADGSSAYGPTNAKILSKASVLTQTNYYKNQTPDILHIREDLATLETQEQQTTQQYNDLYNAVVAGDVDAVMSMLTAQDSSYKQYINTQDAVGATLLMYAAAREHYDIVKSLLEHGANQ